MCTRLENVFEQFAFLLYVREKTKCYVLFIRSAKVGSIAHERMTPSHLNVFESCRVSIISNIVTLRLFVTIHGLPSRREVCILFSCSACIFASGGYEKRERGGDTVRSPGKAGNYVGIPFFPKKCPAVSSLSPPFPRRWDLNMPFFLPRCFGFCRGSDTVAFSSLLFSLFFL